MARRSRDDFDEGTKRTLRERVGSLCSNPECRCQTTGPHTEPTKAVRLGVAAHITAASPGGPRYDPELTSEERGAIDNGIWLCSLCADLVDKDEVAFPVQLLRDWKEKAEGAAGKVLGKPLAAARRRKRWAIPGSLLLVVVLVWVGVRVWRSRVECQALLDDQDRFLTRTDLLAIAEKISRLESLELESEFDLGAQSIEEHIAYALELQKTASMKCTGGAPARNSVWIAKRIETLKMLQADGVMFPGRRPDGSSALYELTRDQSAASSSISIRPRSSRVQIGVVECGRTSEWTEIPLGLTAAVLASTQDEALEALRLSLVPFDCAELEEGDPCQARPEFRWRDSRFFSELLWDGTWQAFAEVGAGSSVRLVCTP